MSNYNLDEDPQDSFEFVLGGVTYKMRYPTTEEVQQGAGITDTTEQTKWIYGFITSDTEGAPSIEEALKKVNTNVLKKFNVMIKAEFSTGA